jgi:glutathione synthase/RimK-type ligase-like ATP-grasp enzyme
MRHFLEGAFLSLGVPWVNGLTETHLAERKLLQLAVAIRLGFFVPETIVATSQQVLRAFLAKHKSVVCKPVYAGLQLTERGGFGTFTHDITAADLDDAEAMENCPTLLQERVAKVGDVRVTFFGAECFSVAIRSANGALDWRRPDVDATYEITSIDARTETLCRTMMSELQLSFGAFDFALTAEGALVFLEVNPAGEWAWLDDKLELGMRESLIRLLDEPAV